MKILTLPFCLFIALSINGCTQHKEETTEDYLNRLPVKNVVENNDETKLKNIAETDFMGLSLGKVFNRKNSEYRFNNFSEYSGISYQRIDKDEGDVIVTLSKNEEIINIKRISLDYDDLSLCQSDYAKDYEGIDSLLEKAEKKEVIDGYIILTYKGQKYKINDKPCSPTGKVFFKDVVVKKKKKRTVEYFEYNYSISIELILNE